MSRLMLFAGFLLGLACLLSPALPTAQAQKKGPEPILPPPQFPTLTSLPTLGAKHGGSTEITLAGTNLGEVTGVLTLAPAKASLAKEAKKGDGTRARVAFDVPSTAPIGLYPIRVATKDGISNVRPIVVDELPEIKEADANNTKDTAQDVPVPCVVYGKVEAESSDFYRIKVAAGQRITFEVLGRRLGSQLDPIVVLHDGKSKRELINLYADDTPGLQTDARLTHTFREPGDIIVEVRDTTYRGGANFTYRLRIGDFPGVTTAFPLAIERGKTASIGFSGPGAEDIPPVSVTAPSETGVVAVRAVPKRAGGVSGWPVPVRVHDFPESVEQEPNNEPAKATPLPVPGGVSARFATPNDLDYFQIVGKKGQKLAINVLAYELNAPTEVLLRVVDSAGKELAKSNPALPKVSVEFTPAADGKYFIVCEHLNYLAGPNEVYHLSVRPAAAEFEFSLPVDTALATPGSGTAIAITNINRLNGFAGPIELSIIGDPALSGSVTVPADATTAYVPLLVKADAKPGVYAFRVQGKAKVGDVETVKFGSTTDPVKASLANLPNPPPEFLGLAALSVSEKLPFELAVSVDPAAVEKGKAGKLIVDVKRNGFDGEITLAPVSPPANVTLTPKPIAKGANKGEVAIAVAAGTATGPASLVLKATGKVGGKDYVLLTVPTAVNVIDGKSPATPAKEPAKKPKEKK